MTAKEYNQLHKSKGKLFIHQFLCRYGFVREFVFAPGRKFRADWAHTERKILVEYEGIFANKSRHTSLTGYSKDLEKYNLATVLGYRVLRYCAKNYKEVENDIKKLLC